MKLQRGGCRHALPRATAFGECLGLHGVAHPLLLQRGARVDLVPHAGPWKTDTALKIAKKMLENERCIKLIEKATKEQASS